MGGQLVSLVWKYFSLIFPSYI